MKFQEKIIKLQTELKVPKNQYNSFGNYKFRSCEDIVEGIKPHLKELNLILIISDEMILLGERYYIKATAKLFDEANSIEATGYAREEKEKKGMGSAQLTGSTSSYARKYALNGLLAIDDNKDDDSAKKHGKELAPKKPASNSKTPPPDKKPATFKQEVTQAQIKYMYTLAGKKGYTDKIKDILIKNYKVSSSKELSKKQYDEIIKKLESKEDKK